MYPQITMLFFSVLFVVYKLFELYSKKSIFYLMDTSSLMVKSGLYLALAMIFFTTTPAKNLLKSDPELSFVIDFLVYTIAFVESIDLFIESIKSKIDKSPYCKNNQDLRWFYGWHFLIFCSICLIFVELSHIFVKFSMS